MNLQKILNEGITINTSGTTGPSKPNYQPINKIKTANKIAREVQMISKKSRIWWKNNKNMEIKKYEGRCRKNW